jgi:MFS family permease
LKATTLPDHHPDASNTQDDPTIERKGWARAMFTYVRKMGEFSPNARYVLIASFLTGLALGAFRLLFNFYVLSIGEGYDEGFIGTLQTFSALSAIIIALPAAYITDRFSHKNLMIITAIGLGAGLLLIVMFPTRIMLILFRMLIGMAFAARMVVIAPFLMVNTGEDERQWVFSFNFGMMTTATFVGNTIGGSLPTWWGGLVGAEPTSTLAYQMAIGTLAFVALFSAVPILFIKWDKSVQQAKPEVPWKLIKRYGWMLLPFFIPQFIVGLGAGLMQPFMNIYFRNVYGQPDPVIGFVFALGGISMAIAQFIAPPLADAKGKIDAVILTQGISIPFLILLGLGALVVPMGWGGAGTWFILAAIAFNIRLGLMNMGNPIYQTFMLEQVPEDVQALTISLHSISFQFGWFVMPQVGGWLQVEMGVYGFVPIFFSVAILYALSIVATLWFFKRPNARNYTPSARAIAQAGGD